MRVPIFVDGDLAVDEIARIFAAAGYHLHSDDAGRLCASRVPPFLRKDTGPVLSNVVKITRRPGVKRA